MGGGLSLWKTEVLVDIYRFEKSRVSQKIWSSKKMSKARIRIHQAYTDRAELA